jgi:hypothetical protein
LIDLDLSGAHPDYRPVVDALFTELLARYPFAALRSMRIGPPRRLGDISMGYYDQDTQDIRFNAYWFARPPEVLQRAAMTPPFFHGEMTDEPRHVVTHEVMHAVQRSIPRIKPRMTEAWAYATRHPESMSADYAFSDETEYFAELGALVDMGFATDAQRDQFKWIVGG